MMSDLNLNEAISFALQKLGLDFKLKNEQFSCIKSIINGKDVLAVLPTGYGKSLIFQILPDVFDFLKYGHPSSDASVSHFVVLIISPLNAIMEDQISLLNEKGVISHMIKGQYVNTGSEHTSLPLRSLTDNENCQLLFVHPEVCVDNKEFQDLLQSEHYQKRVCCVVVDEAHLVKEWQSFRPAYGKLEVLCSFFPNVPHVALTATATKSTQWHILHSLGMKKESVIIEANPDRSNIFFECNTRPSSGEDKLEAILRPLAESLQVMTVNMPLTVIYGTLSMCAECYSYFSQQLGANQYHPRDAEPLAKNRLFTQFHAEYPEHEKNRIVHELVNRTSKARVLFVTVAFGIGVNIADIRHVIHIGVPKTMEEFFQEAGRAGRDGKPAVASLFYNGVDLKKGKNSVNEVMRTYATTSGCRRKVILDYFGHEVPTPTVSHNCCDFHKSICECPTCIVDIAEQLEACSIIENETDKETAGTVEVSPDQLNSIRANLESFRYSILPSQNTCVGSVTFSSGFSLELIERTLEQCGKLNSVEDVMGTLPVFSRANAQVIFDIIRMHIPQVKK